MTESDRKFPVYRVARVVSRLYFQLHNRFESIGSEHVPATGGCIIAANHASFLDPPALGSGLPHRIIRFMARDSLYKKGFVHWFLLSLATIPIAREKGDIAALKRAIQLLKEGHCLGLFPEGTRTLDGNLQTAKGGIGFLIAKAGVPVVPTYVAGTFAAYPRGAKRIGRDPIRILYGRPILPSEIQSLGTGKDAYEQVAALVMARIAELARTAPAAP